MYEFRRLPPELKSHRNFPNIRNEGFCFNQHPAVLFFDPGCRRDLNPQS
jgi:hypothetical protein